MLVRVVREAELTVRLAHLGVGRGGVEPEDLPRRLGERRARLDDPPRRRLLGGGVGARAGAAEGLPVGDCGVEVEERRVALGALLERALVRAAALVEPP